MKQPCVYLLASKRNGTLYVGVTSDLVQLIWQSKNDLGEGFTNPAWLDLYEDLL
jgi:putative endonuclease